jgi:hypothetical protein
VIGDGHEGVELARVEVHPTELLAFALTAQLRNPGISKIKEF